ncbi:hypothetical protein [[Flexibacter] sp. ATCC 35208]|uniref:DoxX family protein n=1 Tax=[Flexibacter] sp. ATCC 35208 TaxID=1936242 RepID=UPI0009CD6B6C|nr:hypothetical protein [[Flexibacter] sp. ATCC 35208]OMP78974.1 hypothetical protein BW716_11450 [[Flexibacter] sp. ATCC 35208]
MKPLIVLLVTFFLSLIIARLSTGEWSLLFAGNVAMCCMLLLTAFGHFKFTNGMVMMLPPVIPFKTAVVYISGIVEIVLGIMLLFPPTRNIAGNLLIILFIVLLPANIYAASINLNIEMANHEGPGYGYLYFRVPLQLLFIGWVLYFSTGWFR